MNKYEKALDALEGMRQIVRREKIVFGEYCEPGQENPNTPCGGHRYCAVGSLWVGYGIKPKVHHDPDLGHEYDHAILPGSGAHRREEFVKNRPGLRLALEHLNASAERVAPAYGVGLEDAEFNDAIEVLFEGIPEAVPGRRKNVNTPKTVRVGREALLKCITQAKRSIRQEMQARA
jgi:hypothetical protein